MNKLLVAIIGAGNIAGGYDKKSLGNDDAVYTHAGAYLAHSSFELNTVYDKDINVANKFKEDWNVNIVTNNFVDVLKKHHDVISVCTPDNTHYQIIKSILESRCCKSIFVEKPIATSVEQCGELIRLSKLTGINIIVNFQRRHEQTHAEIKKVIDKDKNLLSVSGRYMKGLHHVGVTMIDTLCYLFGLPEAVKAYNRVLNKSITEYSYEFILFFPSFNVSIQTIDSDQYEYTYHMFEIDMLFSDKRKTLIDMSQKLRESDVTDYAYSDVKIINDSKSHIKNTDYRKSMLSTVKYLYDVTTNKMQHEVNTPESSFNNLIIINNIIESFESNLEKLKFNNQLWKR